MKKSFYRTTDKGVVILVQAKPLARQDRIVLKKRFVQVETREPAQGGKANRAILKLLSEYFQCPAEIKKGSCSHEKEVLLKGLSGLYK